MNKVFLIGNLTRDPELTETSGGIKICRFAIAVNRNYSGSDGERKTDFFNCVAFGKRAELVNWLNEQNKLSVLVRGELTESEYNGEKQEQLVCSWVQSEQEMEIPKEKPTAKKADDNWGESETEFSD